MNRFSKIVITILFISFQIPIFASEKYDSIRSNHEIIQGTFYVAPAPLPYEKPKSPTEFPDSLGLLSKAPNWLKKYINSLMRGNVDRTHEKKFDVGFGVIPSYTREAGFGIGGAMTGLYRVNRNDSTMQPSDFFASLNASYNGFYVLTIKGNHLFPDHKSRLTYKAEIYRKRLDFWGITAEETAKNPKSKYDRRQIDFQAEYIYKINRNFYAGIQTKADYTDAVNVRNPEYLIGERNNYYVTGIGASFEFDTRDNLVTPTRGIHIAYKPMIYPKFLGNASTTFHSHNLIFNGYFRMWKGSVLALDWYTKINSNNTPWTMREMIASDGIRMRGYYMGSTIDNSQVAAQIEYRQHVWKRLGFVLWGGGATLFSFSDDNVRSDSNKPEWLHNFGVGLRFEFKHNVNIRIDYGFGENTSGILFSIGEAF